MKKVFYSIAITMCLALTVTCFAGCLGGYSIDTNNLIGVWEVYGEENFTDITRIEFKASTEIEGQGAYTYYKANGSTAYHGHWTKRLTEKEFDLLPDDGIYQQAQIATLADGKLWIQFDSETTASFVKVRD